MAAEGFFSDGHVTDSQLMFLLGQEVKMVLNDEIIGHTSFLNLIIN